MNTPQITSKTQLVQAHIQAARAERAKVQAQLLHTFWKALVRTLTPSRLTSAIPAQSLISSPAQLAKLYLSSARITPVGR
ncbi:hypothetical protein [Magnetococcus sp. PR-3]|uniref:hypothetical protein n=1 Tax=Magnetococcus sp. PR-3 TaxID=3120355 RepID=UPI002FCE1109